MNEAQGAGGEVVGRAGAAVAGDAASAEVDAGGVAGAYLGCVGEVLERIRETQLGAIEAAAHRCAEAIASGGVVHAFGTGHSRIIVEELWPRYGSYPGFHPIVELSMTNHAQVTGANGQRQAIFIENVPGLARVVLRNFVLSPSDALIAVSAGGTNVVTVELAEEMRAAGLFVIAITAVEHSKRSQPKAPSGRRLAEVSDLVIDTCTPVGDAAIKLSDLEYPVGPTTTVAAAAIANALKVRVAELLVSMKVWPKVLPTAAVAGAEAAARAFDDAYDEHSRRIARLYAR